MTASVLCSLFAACGGGNSSDPPSAGTSPPPSASLATAAASGASTTPSTASASADATLARFNRPLGITTDGAGNLYVVDSYNFTIRKITKSGVVTTLAGSPGVSGTADGTGTAARFTSPKNIALDSNGNLYVVDSNAIRKITPQGSVTTLAGKADTTGNADGTGADARFNQPWGIAIDAAGNLYVGDTQNYLVRKITKDGVVTTAAGSRNARGNLNGDKATATFVGPRGIAIDGGGNLYVTDWYGPPAPILAQGSSFIRKIAPNGDVTTLAGNFGTGNTAPLFLDLDAIVADASGNTYITYRQTIRKVSPTGAVSAFVGPTQQFDALQGITLDATGTLYVTDTYTFDKVAQDGAITIIAGKFGEMGSADTP